jgi:lysozyme
MDRTKLKQELEIDEGKRRKPYVDTVDKVSIGIGRNLTDNGVSDAEIDFMLENDIDGVEADLDRHIFWWRSMDEVRQRVLANMCFNMGITRLMGFRNTLHWMKQGRYAAAADGMLMSKWASQVGARATRLARMMRDGK